MSTTDLLPGTRYDATCRSCGQPRKILHDIGRVACGCISARWLSYEPPRAETSDVIKSGDRNG
jgi:hypothetical protein